MALVTEVWRREHPDLVTDNAIGPFAGAATDGTTGPFAAAATNGHQPAPSDPVRCAEDRRGGDHCDGPHRPPRT